MEGSNTASRIAELRRRIAANKGIAERARGTRMLLGNKIHRCEQAIAIDQAEIERMGGKVRR
jgi:hypothetical protein